MTTNLLFLLLAAGFLVSAAINVARLSARYTELSRRHDELIGDILETPCQCPPERRGPRPANADPDEVWGCGAAYHPYEASEELLGGLPEAKRAALNLQLLTNMTPMGGPYDGPEFEANMERVYGPRGDEDEAR